MRRGLNLEVEVLDDESLKAFNVNPKSDMDRRIKLYPEKILKTLKNISSADYAVLGVKNPENLIIEALAVGPPQIRPSVRMTGKHKSEDDLTYIY